MGTAFLGLQNRKSGVVEIDEVLYKLFTMPNLATVDMSAIEQGRMEELIAEYGEPGFQINYI